MKKITVIILILSVLFMMSITDAKAFPDTEHEEFSFTQFNDNYGIIYGAVGDGIKVFISKHDIFYLIEDTLVFAKTNIKEKMYFEKVVFFDNMFYVVGSLHTGRGVVLSSKDGKTWNVVLIGEERDTKVTDYFTDHYYFKDLVVVNNKYYVLECCYTKNHFLSIYKNGKQEKFDLVIDGNRVDYSMISINYYGGIFFATFIHNPDDENYIYIMATSSDAIHWTSTNRRIYAFNGNCFVALNENTIETSNDGITWYSSPGFMGENQKIASLDWDGEKFVAISYYLTDYWETLKTEYTYWVYTSVDGINWELKDLLTDFYGYQINLCTGIGTSILTFGYGYLEFDGISLYYRPFKTKGMLKHVKWVTNQYVGHTQNGNIYSSSDGLTWKYADKIPFDNRYLLAYNEKKYVVASWSTHDTLDFYESYDFINWNYVSTLPEFNFKVGSVSNFTYNGNKFILLIRTNDPNEDIYFKTSNDLKNWDKLSSMKEYNSYSYKGLNRKSYFSSLTIGNKSEYVFTGLYGFLARSSDLQNWSIELKVRDFAGLYDDGSGQREINTPIWNGNSYVIPLHESSKVIVTSDFKKYEIKETNLVYSQSSESKIGEYYYSTGIMNGSSVSTIVRSKDGITWESVSDRIAGNIMYDFNDIVEGSSTLVCIAYSHIEVFNKTADGKLNYVDLCKQAKSKVDAKLISTDIEINSNIYNIPVYKIHNKHYVKIRDLSSVLKGTNKYFDVDWNSSAKAILLTTNTSESKYIQTQKTDFTDMQAIKEISKVYYNNNQFYFATFVINNSTYFNIDDLGLLIDFRVTYNNNSVKIETFEDYNTAKN